MVRLGSPRKLVAMGANLPTQHRALGLRNPWVRTLILAFVLVVLGLVTVRGNHSHVRSAIIKTAHAAQNSIGRPSQKAQGDASQDPAWLLSSSSSDSHGQASMLGNSSQSVMTCQCDLDHLDRLRQTYKLAENFDYLRRYVKIVRQDVERKSVTKLTQPLLDGKFKKVDTVKGRCDETCHEPLVVPVSSSPYPSTANLSDFMFSVSTTYKRLIDPATTPLGDWAYWLTDGKGHSNGGKLMLMLLDASADELKEIRAKLEQIGVDAHVEHSDSRLEMAVRYLTLVPKMYDSPARAKKKWLVVCDDDTFFPYLHSLVERFSTYDATQPMYIGTLSEDIFSVERHGSQAFGGAGVFLSVPLAKIIAQNYKECKGEDAITRANTGWGVQGDILLKNCIYDHSSVRLTTLHDLWQLDMWGDPSGFYESGIKPLSIHHYRSWHRAYPHASSKLAHLCGEDCILQRFRTADDFVLTAGFSVAQYPRGIDFDLGQFERTFAPATEDRGFNLDYMLGPQRPILAKTGRKWSWDLQESSVDEAAGSVTQVYARRADDWRWTNEDGSAMGDRDGIIEIVWIA